jgi:hypothetical protein
MNAILTTFRAVRLPLLAAAALAAGLAAQARVEGITGPAFALAARPGYITVPDGTVVYMWGYTTGAQMQYPGPTLIVNEGDTVTVQLTNGLAVPTSIVFPGQVGVTGSGGVQGLLAREAPPGGTVTYSFVASRPGTFTYYSGTRPELQTEMGLIGALIVRPAGFNVNDPANRRAYGHAGSRYDYEYLFLLSEIDPVLHELVEFGQAAQVNFSHRWATIWLINGRGGPDTLSELNAPWLPTQPYNCVPRTRPGEKVLARIVGAGRDLHPFHVHGNNAWAIARDGVLQESAPGAGPNLAVSDFTFTSAPGQTIDALWEWTGAQMGWDIYGHSLAAPEPASFHPLELYAQTTLPSAVGVGDVTFSVPRATAKQFPRAFRALIWDAGFANPDTASNREAVTVQNVPGAGAASDHTFTILTANRGREGTAPLAWPAGSVLAFTDHGVLYPVTLPPQDAVTFGMFTSGSPYLGGAGPLPPGEGGFNPYGAFMYMWHSHSEKELTNNNLWPGGMLTMMVVEPPWVTDIPY